MHYSPRSLSFSPAPPAQLFLCLSDYLYISICLSESKDTMRAHTDKLSEGQKKQTNGYLVVCLRGQCKSDESVAALASRDCKTWGTNKDEETTADSGSRQVKATTRVLSHASNGFVTLFCQYLCQFLTPCICIGWYGTSSNGTRVMEMSRSEGKRKGIQMTQHNEGILEAGAGTRTPQKPLNGELSGCVTVFKLAQIMVFNSTPLITGDGAG